MIVFQSADRTSAQSPGRKPREPHYWIMYSPREAGDSGQYVTINVPFHKRSWYFVALLQKYFFAVRGAD